VRTRASTPSASLRLDQRQFFFKLLFTLVQRLQTQLPAMQLNVELIDITGGFGSLRFVFGQAPLDSL